MRTSTNTHTIDSDGTTVWVNSATYCLGRFGRFGIDIHREPGQHDVGECLFCTHGETTTADWDTFVEKMKELYFIVVPKKHKPVRLLNTKEIA